MYTPLPSERIIKLLLKLIYICSSYNIFSKFYFTQVTYLIKQANFVKVNFIVKTLLQKDSYYINYSLLYYALCICTLRNVRYERGYYFLNSFLDFSLKCNG